MIRLRGLHVAVTGASSGIGAAIAREVASAGAAVTVIARRRPELEALIGELSGRAFAIEWDLADVDRASGWIALAEERMGPIDVLVNNAGRVVVGPTAAIAPDDIRGVVALDLIVPLLLTRAVLPGMLARGRGTIVNMASTGALAPNPGMSHYCAAKAGLAAASESLRGELRRTGVDVVTIYPGPTDTAMLAAATAGYPATRAVTGLPHASPEALARRIRIAIERRKARVIYPRVYSLFRHFPAISRWLLDHLTPAPLVDAGRPS